jgi:hypothetical protein
MVADDAAKKARQQWREAVAALAVRGIPTVAVALMWNFLAATLDRFARVAKELKAGDRLHTTKGTLSIESVEKTGEAACHNLIVPDFNSYFVTDQQILVPDINVRGPTTAIVPGLTSP